MVGKQEQSNRVMLTDALWDFLEHPNKEQREELEMQLRCLRRQPAHAALGLPVESVGRLAVVLGALEALVRSGVEEKERA